MTIPETALRAERASVGSLRSEWNELLRQSSADTIFLTHEWQSLWWEVLGRPDHLEDSTLTVRRDGQLVGIAPLYRSGQSVGLSGGEEIADFLDIIAVDECGEEVIEAVLDALDDVNWTHLTLRNLRAGSTAHTHVYTAAIRRGYRVDVEQEDVSPFIQLPATWDAYLQSLTKKDRHELRRKLRRLHSAGHVTWYPVGAGPNLSADVDDFIRLLKASAEEKAGFMSAQMEAWFHALARQFVPTGQMQLSFLDLDGHRVAAIICFSHNRRLLLYNSGYDPEYAPMSVGLALKAYGIHDAIAAELEVYDFLQGSESYKYDLGAVNAPIYRVDLRRGPVVS